jgi:hypothetical protein
LIERPPEVRRPKRSATHTDEIVVGAASSAKVTGRDQIGFRDVKNIRDVARDERRPPANRMTNL